MAFFECWSVGVSDSFADFINMNFGDTNFSYDFKIKKLSSVGVKNAYISKIITEDGLEGENRASGQNRGPQA